MGRTRIGLTISGAVSLGAFEGGALAALLTAIQAVQAQNPGEPPDLRVDAIGAASAGAITAVAAARILTGGLNATWVMQEAWVKDDSVEVLLHNAGPDAPLSMDGVRQMAEAILNPSADKMDGKRIQAAAVTIDLALTSLRGLDYEIGRIAESSMGRGPIEASTYLDWGRFTFKPGADVPEFTVPVDRSAVDTGLASGANELGFPPKRLARSADDYSGQGLINFPTGANYFWYTDGGTIDNEPLGRTMTITNQIDLEDPPGEADRRLHILIHPFPTAPPPAANLAWADGNKQPTWLNTLVRAFTIIRAQNLYGDLRQAEKTNSHLIWRDRLIKTLRDLTDRLTDEQRQEWGDRLRQVVNDIEADLSQIPRHKRNAASGLADKPPATIVSDVLEVALNRVSNLSGKNVVGIEVVSPYLARGTTGLALDQLLAGDFLQSFGGFFHEGLRRSDFALGFVCMLNWMDEGLRVYGLADDLSQIAIDAALMSFYALEPWTENGQTKGFTEFGLSDDLRQRAEGPLGLVAGDSWTPTYFGEMTLSQLPWRERLLFARVIGRIGSVVGRDLWLKATHQDNP